MWSYFLETTSLLNVALFFVELFSRFSFCKYSDVDLFPGSTVLTSSPLISYIRRRYDILLISSRNCETFCDGTDFLVFATLETFRMTSSYSVIIHFANLVLKSGLENWGRSLEIYPFWAFEGSILSALFLPVLLRVFSWNLNLAMRSFGTFEHLYTRWFQFV